MRASRFLFPLAAAFALIAVPLWLAAPVYGGVVITPGWHGHEMLFGFALAVLAGFLSTRPAPVATWTLIATWFAARVAVAVGNGPLALIAGLSFPVAVLVITAPPLFAGAKRPENRILPALIAALLIVDGAWWAGAVWLGPALQQHALLAAVDLFALLLLIVGGRALPAAVGGYLERRGIARRDAARSEYELPLAMLAGGAVLFDLLGIDRVAGVLCLGAALLTLRRVMAWQLHYTLREPRLWTLALGYLWLIPGLALKGIAQLGGGLSETAMLHAIAIGSIGTLTLTMMARTALLRTRQPLENFADMGVAALLLSAAALSRLLTPLVPVAAGPLLWFAALAWAGAFAVLLARLLRTAARDLDRL